jgi:uncharacterized protein (TIGR02646 family)
VLSVRDSSGRTERDRAVAHHAAETKKSFAYERYKHDDVKSSLHELFSGKCAYCEAYYAGTQPVDVEHYRPKAALDPRDEVEHSGYYWLGSEWANLLPSCIDCNRVRWQTLADGTRIPTGKGARFPLRSGSERARKPGEEILERPLLLDPTSDDPDQDLGFRDDGIIFAVSPRGAASIEIYGLSRVGVTRARQRHAKHVAKSIRDGERALRICDTYPQNADARQIVDEAILALYEMALPGAPFSGMVRSIVRKSVFADVLLSLIGHCA